jgi:hypothetical protein
LASAEVQEWRRRAFEQGIGTTHWPQEENSTCHARKGYVPIELSASQKAVL